MTVHTVEISPSSSEYQYVLYRFRATAGAVNIHKIERIQNPHLYQCYMVRKQKLDEDLGRNSERRLFHGTDSKNVSHINAQGFNRSLCGANGKLFTLYCHGREGEQRFAISMILYLIANLEIKRPSREKGKAKY